MATILISCIENAHTQGWGVYNGGMKLYSNWCKLLRRGGHEAFIVTLDGKAEPWLIEMPPIISLEAAATFTGPDVRFFTGWWVSDLFIQLAPKFYMFDAEMAFSVGHAQHIDHMRKYLDAGRVAKLGTHSRTIQAWYMETTAKTPQFIREWSDTDYWKPAPEKRVPFRVGYMDEGPHTPGVIEQLRQTVDKRAEFVQVAGPEAAVLDQMQQCDVFLGLNPGKHPLWGEGCPRSPQEAMHAGCVVVAFDVHGNHEYLIDEYTGRMVPNGAVFELGRVLDKLLRGMDGYKEKLRANARKFVQANFAPTLGRYDEIARFLDL